MRFVVGVIRPYRSNGQKFESAPGAISRSASMGSRSGAFFPDACGIHWQFGRGDCPASRCNREVVIIGKRLPAKGKGHKADPGHGTGQACR